MFAKRLFQVLIHHITASVEALDYYSALLRKRDKFLSGVEMWRFTRR
jgi:hypothetical protein